MFLQMLIGSGLLMISILVAGTSFWLMEIAITRLDPWLRRSPHRPKLLFVLCAAATWILFQVTIGVWVWAVAFLFLDIFQTLETAIYFALVAFTTLGFGDILLPQEWRLLGGMAAMNGLLNIGLVTAVLVETMRQIRQLQREELPS